METFLRKAFPVVPMLFPPLLSFLHQSSLHVTLFAQSLLLWAGLLGWYLCFQHLAQHITPI